MKKFLLIAFIFINICLLAKADVLPYYINSLRRYGIGYTNVQSPLIMRQTPDKEGKIMETVNFDFKGNVSCLVNKNRCPIEEVFSAYSIKF